MLGHSLELYILGEAAALDLVTKKRFDFILSISDGQIERTRLVDSFAAAQQPGEVLALCFRDIDYPDNGLEPKLADMRKIIHFADKIKLKLDRDEPASVLVHCYAGKCRAPAAAIIIWRRLGWTEENIYNELERLRPWAWPNRLMLTLATSLLASEYP